MRPAIANRIAAARLAEAIASELATAAHAQCQQGRSAESEALYAHARHQRIQAIQLRALAGAAHYLTKGSFHDETLVQAVVDLIGEADA